MILRKVFSVIICLNTLLPINVMAENGYKGLIQPPYPEGCKDLGGTLLQPWKKELEYAVTLIQCKTHYMIWLDEYIKHEGNTAIWRVIDVMTIPTLKKSEGIFDIECDYSKRDTPYVAAVGVWKAKQEGDFVDNIRGAWIVDIEKKR